MAQVPFRDRAHAGRLLGATLTGHNLPDDTIVLGLARGGVVVANAVAKVLNAPLDVVVVRKLGVPWQPELAMGALAGGEIRVLDQELIQQIGVSQPEMQAVVTRERIEEERRERLYRKGRPPLDLTNKTVVLVDDGLATGSSMRAAVRYVESYQPARIIVAVPVGSSEACADLARAADECVCLETPEPFYAVGPWYQNFDQTSDTEVQRLLDHSRPREYSNA
jgi:putative phosphoribosyl transferase